jgi:hypothetical protein
MRILSFGLRSALLLAAIFCLLGFGAFATHLALRIFFAGGLIFTAVAVGKVLGDRLFARKHMRG